MSTQKEKHSKADNKEKDHQQQQAITFRCLILKGHERPITFVKYNRDGDLLFTSSKDKTSAVSVWHTDNGERLGTYEGHKGAVWSVDVNWSCTRLLTASADQTVKLWNVKTGQNLCTWTFKNGVRAVGFAMGDKQFLAATDATLGNQSFIYVFDLPQDLMEGDAKKAHIDSTAKPVIELTGHEKKITHAVWGPLNKTILSCGEDGTIRTWDVETAKQVMSVQAHNKEINRIQLSKDQNILISASSDFSAKLFDVRTMKLLKTYESTKPIRDAAISPSMDHVIIGGGQSAQDVTTTASRSGQFQVQFIHKILCEEVGSVKGHFGPVNALAFAPDGKGYVSGGEDGYVRLHHFDSNYFKLKPDL